ncbi:MAG TPA: PVC-type heme-binding CxxCH protein [Pirellulales bacterium]|nr:PVC-type heme-binding CxxCH protein [Pirellulales bacterium]
MKQFVRFVALSVVAWGMCDTTGRADEPSSQPYDSETDLTAVRLEPAAAAAAFRAPEGFAVNVFAAEPDVMNPIGVAWDTRGRLWVAENYTYAERPKRFDLDLHDRVLIFSDHDGDGRFDERRVFFDEARRLTSIEVGLGGVWLMCPPELLFIPDRDGDDRPDGPAETVLEGFDVPPENYHNFANGLKWGPDGWLYGRCGASAAGEIRRADAPDEFRVPLRGGLWRYHPLRKQFEVICHGTTNPWGHDWNEHGEAFFINTVNGHLWHAIAGAHLRRPHTINANPLVYEPIEMHADHWHWDTGKDWSDSRKATGEHDRLGGGHAHVGMTIYLGRQWPEAYRGRLLTLNQHGRRMNVERLDREGSGYVGRHEPDILQSSDPWFRGVEVTYGPDGSVYLIDWSDTGECHENTGVHRNSGRIYRVAYQGTGAGVERVAAEPSGWDLTKADLARLVALQEESNEWLVRGARRELLNRAGRGDDVAQAVEALDKLLNRTNPIVRLRAVWALYGLGRMPDSRLLALLEDADEHVRTWAVRLLTDVRPLDTATGLSRAEEGKPVASELLDILVRQASADSSGLVRSALASTLQRLPIAARSKLAAALLAHGDDAGDHNLPALIWYGLIPMADRRPELLLPLAVDGQIPQVRRWTARRYGELAARRPELLADLLRRATSKSATARSDIAFGAVAGLAGQRKVVAPDSWPAFLASCSASPSDIEEALRTLGVVFGDGRALDAVRRLALDNQADLDQRRSALQTLIEAQPPDLREICEKLLKVRFLNTTALAGLARFDDPAIGRQLARSYKNFHPSERAAVIETLVLRPTFAAELLDQMAAKSISAGDLSAVQARQIRSFGDAQLTARLGEVWGELRDSPADKQHTIEDLKETLAAKQLTQADKAHGRALFTKTCATCHRLFGSGAEIGPDLTGGNRKNLDYLLSNIVDPSAVVGKDYVMSVLALEDGRIVNGVVVAETETTLTVQTAQKKEIIARGDVETRTPSKLSLMPDGLLQPLSPADIADLFAYLMGDTQVEMVKADVPSPAAPSVGERSE